MENQETDLELHDEVENEVVEEAHDPKNAEQQSIAATDKAGDATKAAPKRKGDKSNAMPMQKMNTKAGMINAMYMAASKMKKEDLAARLSKFMDEDFDAEAVAEAISAPEVQYDYQGELSALVESEATLSEEFKEKTAVLFESALKAKLAEEIDRLEANYAEELQSEIDSTKADLVEKVDSYLNYVVENWMEENKVAIQSGLRTEIAEGFMGKLKDLFTESYIEVPESKVDLVDDLATQVEELEEQLNGAVGNAIQLSEELEQFKRAAIVRESARDLTDTQEEKLMSLVADIDFEDEDSFANKVNIVKESHFNKKTTAQSVVEETDEEDSEMVETSDVMARYVQAIRKSVK